MRIDYTLVFESPWRVASGEAAGRAIDSLVRRDGRGLPFVPGSTVRGLAADALCRLEEPLGLDLCDGTVARSETGALGELCGVTRDGLCPLCALAGSPHRPGRTRWGAARLVLRGRDGEMWKPVWEPEARARLAREAALVPGLLTRAHPHTAIDEATGRAEDEHLFTLEEAAAGLELSGSIEIDREVAPREVSLLVAALRFIRELGGGRRRGLGSCRVRIEEADLAPAFGSWEEAVRALAEDAGKSESEEAGRPAPPPGEASPAAATAGGAAPARLGGTVLEIRATVVGEVVVGGRPEAGNLVRGLPFVPGTAVRGALAARWRGERESEAFERAFLSGRLRFGPLHPLDGQAAARPVPLSLATCKRRPGHRRHFGHGLVDRLLTPEIERCPEPGCGARLIPWARQFSGEAPPVALTMSPHNRIDPELQTVRRGALFAYQALGDGTVLRGFVRGEDGDDLAALLAGLGLAPGGELRLRVGRRKGALGYLACRLAEPSLADSGLGLFPDGPAPPAAWPKEGELRVDLLTPAVVLDPHLRFRTSLVPADLGLDREAWDGAFAATEVLSGWNSTHRLPKPDELAVAAGSSYLLRRRHPAEGAEGAEGTETEELAALRRAALSGVGERRVEGFGAIAVVAASSWLEGKSR